MVHKLKYWNKIKANQKVEALDQNKRQKGKETEKPNVYVIYQGGDTLKLQMAYLAQLSTSAPSVMSIQTGL